MKISYDWLQSLIDKKLPNPEELANLLTMHSFETEVVDQFGQDHLLDVDVLPNRAHDCLSHLGIAKEISVILKYPLKFEEYYKKIKGESIDPIIKVDLKDENDCLRYTARTIIDVKVDSSPDWIQKRLKVCGLKPINNVVDITNYAMIETGQPLHAFDADKLEGQTIIIRRAEKGEKIISLDGEKYDLDESILVIADGQKPVGIAGIKGGEGPEIDQKTKRVILEGANFSPLLIRKASQQLKLRTDASWRFENGISPELTEIGINMASYLIQEEAGGKVAQEKIDIYPNKAKLKKVNLNPDNCRSLLGIDISNKEIGQILESLGFQVKILKEKIEVIPPFWRLDINIEEDCIEEVGRIYGFEKITSQLPEASLIPSERNEDLVYQNKVKEILTNLGFSEVYNYSFVSEGGEIEVLNPISSEQKYLRSSLIPNLLKNVSKNKRYFDQVRIFEIGHVFSKEKKNVIEEKKLGLVLDPANFYRLKGLIETLLNKLRITDVWYDDQFEKDKNKLKEAEVKVGNDLLGWVGQGAFELDFNKLVELATEERTYLPPSKYPSVIRDISLLVEPGTKIVEVMNLINASGGPLIQDLDLFDIYEGDKIPDGRKNLAFHIIFQSDKKTLTDLEVNILQDKIIKALEEEGGWEVRKNNG